VVMGRWGQNKFSEISSVAAKIFVFCSGVKQNCVWPQVFSLPSGNFVWLRPLTLHVSRCCLFSCANSYFNASILNLLFSICCFSAYRLKGMLLTRTLIMMIQSTVPKSQGYGNGRIPSWDHVRAVNEQGFAL